MGNAFQNMILSGLVASLVIAVFLIPIGEANTHYNAGIEITNLSALNRLQNLSDSVSSVKDQAIKEGEVSTQESLAAFFGNFWTVGKFIITGGPFTVIQAMMSDFVTVTGMPTVVFTYIYAVLVLVVVFALLKIITGR